MNMAKLGIVSGAISGFNGWNFLSKINKMRATSYTLCVLDLWVSWNSSRHSFAVNIPPVARIEAQEARSRRSAADSRDSKAASANFHYSNDNSIFFNSHDLLLD